MVFKLLLVWRNDKNSTTENEPSNRMLFFHELKAKTHQTRVQITTRLDYEDAYIIFIVISLLFASENERHCEGIFVVKVLATKTQL